MDCPTCGASLGFYDGPNGSPRCLNCFHDVDVAEAVEAPKPEPNASGTTVAIASAEPAEKQEEKPDEDEKLTKQVKASKVMTTGPKEPEAASVPKGSSVKPSKG